MLLSDVGVNLLVVPAGIFFLSFSKWYVVSNTANSSVRLGIIFSYLERDTHWSGRNATRPIKLDMPCANVLFGFLHGVSRIPGWFRCMQSPAASANPRTRRFSLQGSHKCHSRAKRSKISDQFSSDPSRANEQRCLSRFAQT